MTNKTKEPLLRRFYAYAYTRQWAWVALKYLVLPVLAAVDIVRDHIPEYLAELKDEWAKIEADRKADLQAQAPQ